MENTSLTEKLSIIGYMFNFSNEIAVSPLGFVTTQKRTKDHDVTFQFWEVTHIKAADLKKGHLR